MPLNASLAMILRVDVAEAITIGDANYGIRRMVPITGGSVEGPKIRGEILPGGADWQYVRADAVLMVEARYALRMSDGVLAMITNRGLRRGPEAVMQQLVRNESVDPSAYYFRTMAEFEVPRESVHAWLSNHVFVGVGERAAGRVTIYLYRLIDRACIGLQPVLATGEDARVHSRGTPGKASAPPQGHAFIITY